MDRRQKKTKNAIFKAFINLLNKKDFSAITVGEIIDDADVGRATFYSHFETKDFLLKALCEELFFHILEAALGDNDNTHYNDCSVKGSSLVHLLCHLQNNDDNILKLLSGRNNKLFLGYFKEGLKRVIAERLDSLEIKCKADIPESYLMNYIVTAFVETVIWWQNEAPDTTPQKTAEYFFAVTQSVADLKNA